MKWYMIRTAGSSTSVSGLVKIAKKNCDLCDLPIITHKPNAKVSCSLVNFELFDIDFCLIDAAIVYRSELSHTVGAWVNHEAHVQRWKPKTDQDLFDGFVLSIASLPAVPLADGLGIGRLPPCTKCHPRERPNLLYDFSASPVVHSFQLIGSDIIRIEGDTSLLISEKIFEFLQSVRVGSISTSFIPAIIRS